MNVPSSPGLLDRARLRPLAAALGEAHASLRYVDYRQAERDCEVLAAKLRAELPRDFLASARFEAVPRGGLIVLGMLAYSLELTPEQLSPAGDREASRVLIDDCALTGGRLGQAMRGLEGAGEVVMATLYSHPDLRRAVERRESRVRACLAARDLEEWPRSKSDGWSERWRERLGDTRYWIGSPEWIAFAWSEPDRPFWNPVSETVEDGWRFLPPHLCLKNRCLLGGSASVSAWRLAEGVVFGEFDGILWLCELASGEVLSLGGVALEMFRHLLCEGLNGAAVDSLVTRWRVDEATARHDFLAFAETLRERGLLMPPDDRD
ncbi:MAG: hypothetical protein AAF481_14000 [Acidobacteriota bacterium]